MKTKILFPTFLLFILLFSTLNLLAQWVQVDGPQGGNIHAIENNDNYCFAQTSNLIYRSVDDGDHWEKIQIGPHSKSGKLSVNGDNLAVVIYEYNDILHEELYVSEDNGNSWDFVPLPDTAQNIHYTAITSNGIYIASYYDVWLTQNMGETWEYGIINDEIPLIHDMKVFNQKIYFGGHKKIIRIEENGADWEVLNIPEADDNIGYIFVDGDVILAGGGQYNKLYRSNTAGESWNVVDGNWYGSRRRFVIVNGNYYTLGTDGILKSENQGTSWDVVGQVSSNIPISFFGKSGEKLLLGTNYKGIYQSSDLGITWHPSSLGMNDANVYDIIQIGNVKFAGVYGGLFKKESEDTSWNTTNLFPVQHEITDLDQSSNNLFITKYNTPGTVFKSNDLGDTWINATPQDQWGDDLGAYNHIQVDNGAVYVWNNESFDELMKSTDEGVTWTNIETNLYEQLGIFPTYISIDDGVIYSLAWIEGKMAKSIDAGETWSLFGTTFSIGGKYFDKLEVRNGLIFANINGYNQLYISHDGGDTFFNASSELPLQTSSEPIFKSIKSLDENIFIIGTSGLNGGVHITFNKGINWTPFNYGFEGHFSPNTILVDDTYLWVGTTYKGIWKRPLTDIEGIQIFGGHVFEDDNNNDIEDANESGFANVLLSQNGERYTTTNTEGNYSFYSWNGQGDTIKAIKPVLYSEVSPAYHVFDTNDSLYTFSVNVQPNISDLRITITRVGVPRPGFDHKYIITYKNAGTVTLDGQISFDFDEILTYLDASPLPTEVMESNLKWDFLALAPEESRNLIINFNIPATIPIGTVLSSFVQITPIDEDQQTSDNTDLLEEEVIGSYDPNDKEVEPKDEFTTQQLEDGQKLIYTIRFQNTGNHPAEFVRITDQLQSILDVSTFEVLSASHSYTYTIKGTGFVEFYFENIQLPDSTSNEVESHGFIKFAVAAKKTLPIGIIIENFADIYFDYNTPIRTNKARITITTPTFIRKMIEAPTPIKVFPNPGAGLVFLEFEEPQSGNISFLIVDNTGRTVKSGKFIQKPIVKLDLMTLQSGLYYILMKSKGKNYIGKILIQK